MNIYGRSISEIGSEVAMFFVFRRNDGYIHAIASNNRASADRRLAPRPGASFEILLETSDWPVARERIRSERGTAAGEQHECRLAPTEDGGDLDFVATYGGPGKGAWGSAWDCRVCGREWSKVGGKFYDPAEQAHILTIEDVR
jgi:hypothetical protein